jgi:hypothetical protein
LVVDPFDDLLFVLTLLESAVCLACAFTIVLLIPYGGDYARLTPHVGLFAGAALMLLMTAAVGDGYHRLRRHRSK